jgi:hypothetical protein
MELKKANDQIGTLTKQLEAQAKQLEAQAAKIDVQTKQLVELMARVDDLAKKAAEKPPEPPK